MVDADDDLLDGVVIEETHSFFLPLLGSYQILDQGKLPNIVACAPFHQDFFDLFIGQGFWLSKKTFQKRAPLNQAAGSGLARGFGLLLGEPLYLVFVLGDFLFRFRDSFV